MQELCCISSFDSDLIKYVKTLSSIHSYKIDTVQLYNFYDSLELPEPCEYTNSADSINISSKKVTEEVVQNCHSKGV